MLCKGQHLALELLADACALACREESDPWEFAIELSHLMAAGATVNDLRWLAVEGYAEHAVEVGRPDERVRRFRHSCNLGFPARTCFVATAAGVRAANSLAGRRPAATNEIHYPHALVESPPGDALTPSWDAGRRTLCLDKWIVKQFHVPAPTQEIILRAFEEEHWPRAIDDPLPPQGAFDPKRRLRSTLESLNRGHENRLVRFRGDGTGQRIVWELTSEAIRRAA